MIVIFIPFSLIAILALVALVAGGAAVGAAVSFLAEHFLAVSLVLWAVTALIAWAVQQEKGIAGRLYVLSTTLTAAPVFAVTIPTLLGYFGISFLCSKSNKPSSLSLYFNRSSSSNSLPSPSCLILAA